MKTYVFDLFFPLRYIFTFRDKAKASAAQAVGFRFLSLFILMEVKYSTRHFFPGLPRLLSFHRKKLEKAGEKSKYTRIWVL